MTGEADISRSTQQPVVDRLLASRDALFETAEPSLASSRRLAALADECVAALARDATPPGPWAVIALGGYGSGRLLPGSDLDLLIVSDAPAKAVKRFAEAVFYPLWDSGLPVGHQVRSRREQSRATVADTATLTAALTGRVVAGDVKLGEKLLSDIAARASKDRKRVLRALADRPRPGSPYLLEPDLKEGAGGQRDLDELTWTAAVLSGAPASDPSPLVALGILTAEELERLAAASEVLTAARWLLHRAEPRHREVLSVENAEDLPESACLAEALADVSHTLVRVRRRLAGTPQPALPDTPAALFAALAEGSPALPLLEEAVWAGALEPLLPGMRALTYLRRPGLSHTLTVGAHCLAAAAFVADAPSRDSFAAEALERIPDRRPLMTAALTHDFGKRHPGPGHPERGEEYARQAAVALGVAEAAEEVAVLVREHLLLAETTWRADLADEDGMLRAAATLGRRELVAPLYVITLVDTLATGPGVWTPWRAAITSELATRLDAALSPDVAGAGIAAAAEATRVRALALLAGAGDRERAFVELAPLRYLASTSPEAVAAHAKLAAPIIGVRDPAEAAIAVSMGPLPSTWRVTIATRDRPGLFACLAGVFALSGLSIMGADALAGPENTAIDGFTVESATLAAVDTSTWATFERNLHASLSGHLSLEVRLAERRRHYPRRLEGFATQVTVDASGEFATALRVETADRVGLLHDLAHALAADALDIRSATVLTHDGVASDTFRVVDAAGEPPRDPVLLAAVAQHLTQAAQ